MSLGGNKRGREFFKSHGWDDSGADASKIDAKYHTRAAQLYRDTLGRETRAAAAAVSAQTAPVAAISPAVNRNSIGSDPNSPGSPTGAGAKHHSPQKPAPIQVIRAAPTAAPTHHDGGGAGGGGGFTGFESTTMKTTTTTCN